MNKAIVVLAALLAIGVNCNFRQELVNGIRGMKRTEFINPHGVIHNCNGHSHWYPYHLQRNQVDNQANFQHKVWFDGRNQHRKLAENMKELKFGTRTLSMSFENFVGQSRSGVIAKATIGRRIGESVEYLGIAASLNCDMKQQHNTVAIHKSSKGFLRRRKHWTEYKQIERGLNPHELNLALNYLQNTAIQNMLHTVTSKTGLSASEDDSLQRLYFDESLKLRSFYPEIEYDYSEVNGVAHQDIGNAIREGSHYRISDHVVLNRISQLTASAQRTSFFHTPNNEYLYVFSINKNGNEYTILMSSFKVYQKFPANAFAVSVGVWSLENHGHGGHPSAHELLKVFPPLK